MQMNRLLQENWRASLESAAQVIRAGYGSDSCSDSGNFYQQQEDM